MSRVGVFICHCGENIGRTVDCARVAQTLESLPGVVHSIDYKYMCSDPGQALIKQAIREKGLDRIVVGACSPHMHEKTFRKAAASAGLNPFLCEMANLREHCSWIHEDRERATNKAVDLARFIVEKIKYNRPLSTIHIPVERRALVIGGGIAGIQAALDIADGGCDVILVEKEPSIGGHMSQLSETFPTLDCSQCILTPRMVEVAQHPRNKLLAYSEVDAVEGYIGNFQVRIRRKARSVDETKCNGCGECTFCIASSPTRKGYIEASFKAVGKVTQAMRRLNVGDTMGFRGPYGNHFPLEEMFGKSIVFIAGGIGLAPVRCVIWNALDLRDRFKDVTIIYGARSVADLVYRRELEEWGVDPMSGCINAWTPEAKPPNGKGMSASFPLLWKERIPRRKMPMPSCAGRRSLSGSACRFWKRRAFGRSGFTRPWKTG
jgi:ferredoxin